MRTRRLRAIVAKDLKECLGSKMVVLPMILLPLIICVVMPAALTVIGLGSGASSLNGAQVIERILPLYDIPARFQGIVERLLYVLLNFTLMPFFLIIPLMVSVTIAAWSVAGEKERKSLETLLYTPLSNEEFVLAKLLSAFVPAMAISLGSFILYFGASNAAFFALRGVFVIDSPVWIPVLLIVDPAVALLGLGLTFIMSLKAKSYIEAQQGAAFIVLPCVLLIGGQASGLVVFSPLAVLAFGLALLAVDYIIITRVGPRFDRERAIDLLR